MKRWLPLFVAVFGLYLVLLWQQGGLQWLRDPATLSGNTCDGKKFCAVVYLAPWCPHCRAAMGETQAFLAKSKFGDTGVKVVVGNGQHPGDNEAMARKIASTGVVIDGDEQIAAKLGVHEFPSAVILDGEGTKIIDGQEGREWLVEKFSR